MKVKVIWNQWHLKTIEWAISDSLWICESNRRSIWNFTRPWLYLPLPFCINCRALAWEGVYVYKLAFFFWLSPRTYHFLFEKRLIIDRDGGTSDEIWGGGQGGRLLPPPAPLPPPPALSSPSSLLERRALRARKNFLFPPPSLSSSPLLLPPHLLPPPAPSSPSSLPLFSPLPPPLLLPPSYPVRPLKYRTIVDFRTVTRLPP